MSKRFNIVALVVGLALTGTSCNPKTQTSVPASPTSIKTSTPSESQSSQSVNSEAAITIQNFAFSPNTVTVKPGEKITVTNKDTVGHTVTSDDGTSFDTGILGQGQSATITAPTKPGTYGFNCTPHQTSMTGTLTVEE